MFSPSEYLAKSTTPLHLHSISIEIRSSESLLATEAI